MIVAAEGQLLSGSILIEARELWPINLNTFGGDNVGVGRV